MAKWYFLFVDSTIFYIKVTSIVAYVTVNYVNRLMSWYYHI